MGHTHFLTRTRPKVAAEMNVHILTDNLRRVLNIIGAGALMAAMQPA